MDRGMTSKGQFEVPVDLRNALSDHPSALEAWRRLSPEDQRAHIESLASGADPVARERCLRTLVNDLAVQVPNQSRR